MSIKYIEEKKQARIEEKNIMVCSIDIKAEGSSLDDVFKLC